MRHPIILASAAILLWASTAVAGPPQVLLTQPESSGVDPETARAFRGLLQTELLKYGKQLTLVPESETPGEPCGEPECAGKLAKTAGADQGIAIALTKLSEKIIIRVVLADREGKVLFADRGTALTLDDLDQLSQRIGNSVAHKKDIKKTVTVDSVTKNESQDPKRRKSLFSGGIKLGAFVPVGGSYAGGNYFTDIGAVAWYDISSFTALLEFDVLFSTSSSDVSGGGVGMNMGLQYYWSPSDIAQFVEGGISYRAVAFNNLVFDNDNGSGLGIFTGTGVTFLRTSDVHMFANVRYELSFFGIGDNDSLSHAAIATVGITHKSMRYLFLAPFFCFR